MEHAWMRKALPRRGEKEEKKKNSERPGFEPGATRAARGRSLINFFLQT